MFGFYLLGLDFGVGFYVYNLGLDVRFSVGGLDFKFGL